MARLEDVIGYGTHAARPAAGSAGALYYETDTATTFRDNGSTWDALTPGAAGLYSAYVNVQDQKTQNTAGGTFTAGAWRTRNLNTVVSDTAGVVTLSSNQLVLPAGTYDALITVPACYVSYHQARLYNVTDSTTLLLGTTALSPATGTNMALSVSMISGTFTVGASKQLEVQHICAITKSTDGFGQAGNFAGEVYTVVQLWQR